MTAAVERGSPTRPVPRLLVITDAAACRAQGRTVVDTVRLLVEAATPAVAVLHRAKELSPSARADELATLMALARAHGLRLLGHASSLEEAERVVVGAQAANHGGLAGLHLASSLASSDELAAVRALLGPGRLLGASRHRGDPLGAEDVADVDFATLSPVFAPASKPDDTRPPLGVAGLGAACARATLPVLALGGVTAETVADLLGAGAHGVAVLGGVMGAPDPASALRVYLAALARR